MSQEQVDARTRQHKDRGAELLARGKVEAALGEYQRAVELSRNDVVARRKVAELLARLGRNAEAVQVYQLLAGRFAAEGRLLEAIAISKVVLQLEPKHVETQETLAKLYARRSSSPGLQRMPPSMSGAIDPQQARAARVLPASRLPESTEPGELDAALSGSPDDAVPLEEGDASASAESRDASAGADSRPGESRGPKSVHAREVAKKRPPPVLTPQARPPEAPAVAAPSVDIVLSELPASPLFSELPPQVMQVLLERLTMLPFAAGQDIIVEGEPGNALFVLASGSVEVVRAGPSGKRQVLDRMTDGAFFGEIGLVADVPRLATVVAAEDCVVLGVTRELIDELSKTFPFLEGLVRTFYKARLLSNLLRASPIFAPLGAEDRAALVEKFTLIRAKPGDKLLTQGEPGRGLFLLLRGRCGVTFHDVAGVDHVLPELSEGAVMGEISLITGSTATATVTAKTTSVLFRLEPGPFVEHIFSNPIARALVTKMSSERLERTDALEFSSLDPALL